jgi:putative ABC transport system permease protein
MMRHLFKLVWNRRRANGLILTELTLCFLVLCAALTMASYYAINWNKPLGFDYHNLWRMDLTMNVTGKLSDEQLAAQRELMRQIQLLMQGMDEIEAATPSEVNFPYSNSGMGYRNQLYGKERFVRDCRVLPEALETFGLKLVAGRWVEPGDENLNWRPVVITRDYARAMFGDDDPIGKRVVIAGESGVSVEDDGTRKKEKERRVVGVVAEYRIASELRPPAPVDFSAVDMGKGSPPETWAIRTHPGVTAAYQEKLINGIRGIAPEWTVDIEPVSSLRARELRVNLVQLAIWSIVAGFLIITVGLGLVGVLWQSVTRRTEEMGIRRSLGATGNRVRWQVLGELLALTTVAVVIGSAMYLQFPILQVIGWMPWQAYALALAGGLVVLYLFVIACGLYPAWLATRVQPAEALQYE